MADYEYTDLDGVRMNIDGYTTEVNLYLTKQPNQVSTIIPATHAPAVALAILEAAGYGKTEAAGYVRGQVEALVKLAEREAEDAKVRAWWDETRYGHTTSLAWGHMGESAHEDVRKQYHLARRFFEGS